MPMKKRIGYDIDDILSLVRLQRRRPLARLAIPAAGLLVLGVVIGGGAGLMLAPLSGRRLRQEVVGRMDRIRERMMKSDHRKEAMNVS